MGSNKLFLLTQPTQPVLAAAHEVVLTIEQAGKLGRLMLQVLPSDTLSTGQALTAKCNLRLPIEKTECFVYINQGPGERKSPD